MLLRLCAEERIARELRAAVEQLVAQPMKAWSPERDSNGQQPSPENGVFVNRLPASLPGEGGELGPRVQPGLLANDRAELENRSPAPDLKIWWGSWPPSDQTTNKLKPQTSDAQRRNRGLAANRESQLRPGQPN